MYLILIATLPLSQINIEIIFACLRKKCYGAHSETRFADGNFAVPADFSLLQVKLVHLCACNAIAICYSIF